MAAAPVSTTRVLPLSGMGEPGEAPVLWDFQVSAGRRAGEWTQIRVPSCWEAEGFGTYYYGIQGRGKPDDDPVIPKEVGKYRTKFTVPADWQGSAVRIVFEAAMTDTEVLINGQPAGPVHQGGFYRFHYDITPLVKFGTENLLEVTVFKESANKSVNHAERRGDYWCFGGIYRPVWLEARPAQHIEWTAIDARADGSFYAQVHLGAPASPGARVVAEILDAENRPMGAAFSSPVDIHGRIAVLRGRVEHPKLWTAEAPHLYRVRFTLALPKGQSAHEVVERFGFRTFEVRPRDGLYLNGAKIVLKGVNRHCFWPETGRTLTREQSYADARQIKSGNMNAVRMSHYTPDKHFLEACDELGLYVLDELTGWQGSYDTPTGTRLIGQIVRRDVNHPSILFWDNGNEGGWNREVDGEFDRWDPQRRPVLHPWAIHSGINTDHYERYASTTKLSSGPDIFMPTEFLHGLYDGGIGAGFRDFWDLMGNSPTCAGGFFWVWSDEGLVRTDQDGRIDNMGNLAPDGMVGPHREPEGSYYAVKEIWSPVQLSGLAYDPSRGELRFQVHNAYDFTPLEVCTFTWRAISLPKPGEKSAGQKTIAQGEFKAPAVAPRERQDFATQLPRETVGSGDLLLLSARDPYGHELWTWSLPLAAGKADALRGQPADPAQIKQPFELRPTLVALRRKERVFENVPVPASALVSEWSRLPDGSWRLDYHYSVDGELDVLGIRFHLPDSALKSKRWLGDGPYRTWQNRQEGGVFDLHEVAFNDPIPGQTYAFPEFKGFFRDWRWLTLETTGGQVTVENVSGVPYFGLGKIKSGEKDLVTEWPDMGLAFLHVIPAIGTKFDFPEMLGPQSQPRKVSGVQRGSLIFKFSPP